MNEHEKRLATLAFMQGEGHTKQDAIDTMMALAGIPDAAVAKWREAHGVAEDAQPVAREVENPKEKYTEVALRGPILSAGNAEFTRWLGGEATSAKDVREALSKIKGDITLRINSPGGAVSQMAEIVSLLAERRKNGDKVKAIADGVAASAAATIFLVASDERLMSEFATLMYHRSRVLMILAGPAPMIEKETTGVVSQLRAFDETLIAAIARITGKDESEAEAIIDNETWYNRAQAIEEGFATGEAFDEQGDEDGAENVADEPVNSGVVEYAHATETLRAILALNDIRGTNDE